MFAIRGRLMKSHRIREGNSKNFVVCRSNTVQHLAQIPGILRRKFIHASDVSSAADQDFKRPNRPEGYNSYESFVLEQ